MAHNNFHLLSFQRKVKDALQTVERTLELEHKPQLADEVDHVYGAKYGLTNLVSDKVHAISDRPISAYNNIIRYKYKYGISILTLLFLNSISS